MPYRHPRKTRLSRRNKQTHKIEPQICVLWIPDERGFLSGFTREGFTVTDTPHLAQRFCEHLAPSAAMEMRDLFGVRAVVRPHHGKEPVVAITPHGESLLAQAVQSAYRH